MAKIELNSVTSGYNLSAINDNFQRVEDELKNKVMYVDEVSPMERALDMNGQDILNADSIVAQQVQIGNIVLTDAEFNPESSAALRGDLAGTGGAGMVGWIRSAVGAVARWLSDKLSDTTNIKDYGALCNGVADDTVAWKAALANEPAGRTIEFNGFSVISETLVFQKPMNIRGGTREQNGFLVASSGTYKSTPDGERVAIWLPHSTTIVPGETAGIDARRSVLSGFTIKPATASPANMRGIVLSVVSHFENVASESFSSDGWAVLASNDPASEPIPSLPRGNANGFTLKNCLGMLNGGDGLYLAGNNTNAGDYGNFVAANNAGYGVNDQSFLGNNGSPEVDGNTLGGFLSSTLTSSKSTLFGMYSETTPHGTLGDGTLSINPKNIKPSRAGGGVMFSVVPEGAYLTRDLLFAATDDTANSKGAAPNAGAFLGIGSDGIDYKSSASANRIQLNGLFSTNYAATWYNGGVEVLSFPQSAFTGNIAPNRLHFHAGFTLGGSGKSGVVGAGTAAPTSGFFNQGAIWLNDNATSGGFVGWVCTAGGTPGTWRTFGAIS